MGSGQIGRWADGIGQKPVLSTRQSVATQYSAKAESLRLFVEERSEKGRCRIHRKERYVLTTAYCPLPFCRPAHLPICPPADLPTCRSAHCRSAHCRSAHLPSSFSRSLLLRKAEYRKWKGGISGSPLCRCSGQSYSRRPARRIAAVPASRNLR